MSNKATRFYLLFGSFGLVVATLLFYTVLSHIVSPTLKILTAFSSLLLTISTMTYLFIRPVEAGSSESKVLTFASFLVLLLSILSLTIDVQLNGARSFSTLMLMGLGMFLAYLDAILNSNKSSISIATMLAFVMTFLASTYAFFPPSLGIDAWRDIIYSVEIQESGYIPSQAHPAYPIPLVSLTYSIYGLVIGMDVRWTTGFIGLEYLFVVLLSLLLITRRLIESKKKASSDASARIPLFASFLVILSPLIVRWSLEPIPQAYATVLMLSILLLISFQKNSKSEYMATLPSLVAMVLAHGGVMLWFITFLSFWLLTSFFLRESEGGVTKLIGKVLRTATVVTLAYWVYTTVIEVILQSSRNIWSLLIDLISGRVISRSAETLAPVPWYNVVLSYSAFYISLVFAFVGWSVCKEVAYLKKSVINTIFFSGITSVAIAFVGYTFNPDFVLDRYLGLPAFIILAIPASVGLYVVYTRGIVGKVFVSLAIITMILGIVIGGFYTPDYAPLGRPGWYSQKAPPTYGEASSLEHLSLMTKGNSILIDLKAGMILYHSITQREVKVLANERAVNITLIGYYGLIVNEKDIMDHLNHKNAIFVYREGALEKLGLIVGVDEGQLLKTIDAKGKVYDSGKIQVFTGS